MVTTRNLPFSTMWESRSPSEYPLYAALLPKYLLSGSGANRTLPPTALPVCRSISRPVTTTPFVIWMSCRIGVSPSVSLIRADHIRYGVVFSSRVRVWTRYSRFLTRPVSRYLPSLSDVAMTCELYPDPEVTMTLGIGLPVWASVTVPSITFEPSRMASTFGPLKSGGWPGVRSSGGILSWAALLIGPASSPGRVTTYTLALPYPGAAISTWPTRSIPSPFRVNRPSLSVLPAPWSDSKGMYMRSFINRRASCHSFFHPARNWSSLPAGTRTATTLTAAPGTGLPSVSMTRPSTGWSPARVTAVSWVPVASSRLAQPIACPPAPTIKYRVYSVFSTSTRNVPSTAVSPTTLAPMSSSLVGGSFLAYGTYSLAPDTGLPSASVTLPVTTSFSPAGGFGASLAAAAGRSFLGGASVEVWAAIRVPTPIRTAAARALPHRRVDASTGETPRARADTAGRTGPEPAIDTTESTHAGGAAEPGVTATAASNPADRAMPRRCRRSRSFTRPRSRLPLTIPTDQPSSAAASSRLLPSR